jgi:hypothetical protein
MYDIIRAYQFYQRKIGEQVTIKGSAFNKNKNGTRSIVMQGKILQVHKNYVLVKFNETHTEGFHFTQLKGSENFCHF